MKIPLICFLLLVRFSAVASPADFQLAVGGSLGLQIRRDYGEGSFKRLYPEFVTLGYVSTPVSNLWLRPGFRLAYVTEQPEMPQGLRLEERDLVTSLEAGFVYEWYVVPSFSAAGGLARRSLELKTSEPIEIKDGIKSTENLLFCHFQVGVGIPLGKGFAVLEPFYRYNLYQKDNRIGSQYGLEMTLQVL
jgi:hypothetical protein